MSWVKPTVDKLLDDVPMAIEQQKLLRSALSAELEKIARRQEHLEAESNENYAGELLWKFEARRLRQAVADLSSYIEEHSDVEHLPKHVSRAMDAIFPPAPKGK